jgi:heme-degrading monooxygenase HmoA
MIQEIATLDIKASELDAFKGVLQEAKLIISQSKGFVSMNFQQCIENPTQFLAIINWQTLEDHTVGFRESELFVQWRAVLSPFFNSPPAAVHYHLL